MTRSRESGVVGGGEGTAGTGEEGRIGRERNSLGKKVKGEGSLGGERGVGGGGRKDREGK